MEWGFLCTDLQLNICRDEFSEHTVSVSENYLMVKGLDAIDGTPILDIKPYYPVYDQKNAKVPECLVAFWGGDRLSEWDVMELREYLDSME